MEDTIVAVLLDGASEHFPHSLPSSRHGAACARVDLERVGWVWCSDGDSMQYNMFHKLEHTSKVSGCFSTRLKMGLTLLQTTNLLPLK